LRKRNEINNLVVNRRFEKKELNQQVVNHMGDIFFFFFHFLGYSCFLIVSMEVQGIEFVFT